MSTSLTLPARSETGFSCLSAYSVHITKRCDPRAAFAQLRWSSFDPRDIPARAGHGPDASPRDTLTRATLPAAPPHALRANHTDRSTPRLAPSLPFPQLLTLGLEWGMHRGLRCASAGEARHRPPHGTRDSLPSLWPLSRPSAFGASAFGASAFGARGLPRQGPARYSGPLPSVHSPLHLPDSALLCSARCLPPAKSTS